MCRATTCRTCGKTTWAGCGQHVASVKATVPARRGRAGRHSDAEVDAARAQKPQGFLARLFNR